MNVAATGTELITTQALKGEVVFAPGGVDKLIEQVTAEVRAFKGDISTKAGRQAVASFAYKVARSKTAIDNLGKDLAADLKRKTAAIDTERRRAWDAIEALQAEARKPLTDWEEADKARIAEHEAMLVLISDAAVHGEANPSIENIDAQLKLLAEFPPRDWQEFKDRADGAMLAATSSLTTLRETVVKREAERAELERLRREQAEREQRERDEKIASEAAARARQEAETKAAREAKEAAEREAAEQRRLIQEREDADERARKAEADRIAAVEKAEADKKAAAEAAQRERDRAVEAERRHIADERAAAAIEAKRREASTVHRGKINSEALAAIVKLGISEDHGKAVITAIAKGAIPHVSISY